MEKVELGAPLGYTDSLVEKPCKLLTKGDCTKGVLT